MKDELEAIREAFLAPEWGRQHVARGVSPGRTGRHPPPDFPCPPPQPRATNLFHMRRKPM